MVGVRDPKKRKRFCFEFVSSESKLKAKFTLVIKIFRAVNCCRNNFAVIYLLPETDSGDEQSGFYTCRSK